MSIVCPYKIPYKHRKSLIQEIIMTTEPRPHLQIGMSEICVPAYLVFSNCSVNFTPLSHVSMVIISKHYPGNNRGSQYQFLEGVGMSQTC